MLALGVARAWIFLGVVQSLVPALSSSPIVNGKVDKSNQFPFSVAFATRKTAGNSESFSLFCGGTLITQSSESSWAISASHCFLDFKNDSIHAMVGGGDLTVGKWWPVEEIIQARMNIYTYLNDIALVKIAGNHQQVLPRATAMPANNAECLIYGYGSDNYRTSTITSNTIRFGWINVISYDRCESLLGRVMAPISGTSQFCALGKNGADACGGDSGSGLICRDEKGQAVLVGVTSHGMGCGDGMPGVYESVIHHKAWIDSQLATKTS